MIPEKTSYQGRYFFLLKFILIATVTLLLSAQTPRRSVCRDSQCDELFTTLLAVQRCSDNKNVRLSYGPTEACFRYKKKAFIFTYNSKTIYSGLMNRVREMLPAQGTELSRASVVISTLISRLKQLVEVDGTTWKEDSTSDVSEESASDPAVQERQQLEGQGRSAGTITRTGLTEQISQVEQMMDNVICVNMVGSQENMSNANVNTNMDLETLDLEVTWRIIQVSQG